MTTKAQSTPKNEDSRVRRLGLVCCLLAGTPAAVYVGLLGGRHLLPLLQAACFFPLFFFLLSRQRWRETVVMSLLWALLTALLVGWASFHFRPYAEERILLGAAYREEMLEWIRSGLGRESNIREFLPQHLLHFALFALLTAASGGFLGLVMGAILLDYMSFYVGALSASAHHPAAVLLLAWPPWAMLRVAAYILVATALSAVFYQRLFRYDFEPGSIRHVLKWGAILLLADVLLKWWLAPQWQRWLYSLTYE